MGERGINIYINSKKITQEGSIKYLGITIDKNFSFTEHIENATPILIEINKIASYYKFRTGHRFHGYEVDRALHYTKWPHSADKVEFNDKQEGNELADKLAKRAARNKDLEVCYERIPESEWLRVLREESISQREKDWQTTTKGPVTKSYFPSVKDRLRVNIPLNSNLATFLTGHGQLRVYFHRFHILDSPECPCGKGDQTAEHLIFQCAILDKERNVLRNNILKLGVLSGYSSGFGIVEQDNVGNFVVTLGQVMNMLVIIFRVVFVVVIVVAVVLVDNGTRDGDSDSNVHGGDDSSRKTATGMAQSVKALACRSEVALECGFDPRLD
ncbi:hypothetical protein ANN_04032 [Periplaneta americana]|uniref:Reverse transcriptase n=1 Tax=Periplaneta americana TaxID=6978 RepID=A0ABQ8T8N1_PERAM|nr:hypothetical protein ANN_04032 [Periplaneta americana]